MRSNLLQRYPSSGVRVYVVWFDMLTGDSRDLVDRRVLNDHRVANYYDRNKVVGTWYAERSGGGGTVWDAYFLYGADATWTDAPQPLVSSGGTVIDQSAELAAAFAQLA